MNDQEIIERCRERDPAGQRALYELTALRVYRVLLKMTHNWHDAQDLAQNTYLQVFENIHRLDSPSRLVSWVYRVAVNEALQFLRRRRTGNRKLEEIAQVRNAGTPGETLDDRLDVSQALAQLSEDERALIVLRYFEGLNYSEIGEVLQKPPGTVASGLNRARAALKSLLNA